MKKLKLKLNGIQALSKDHMKKITGGYDTTYTTTCPCCYDNRYITYLGNEFADCEWLCDFASQQGLCN